MTRQQALQQSIADLEYIRAHPGNLDVLLEKRRGDLRDADVVSENAVESTSRESDQQFHMSETAASIHDVIQATYDAEVKKTATVDRYEVNDMLTSFSFQVGIRLEDDDLNDLTHQVAEFLETRGKEFA